MPQYTREITHLHTLYENYKHFDVILSSPNFEPANVEGQMLRELWQVVKALYVATPDKNLDLYLEKKIPPSLLEELYRLGLSPAGFFNLVSEIIVDYRNEQQFRQM
jgi:hypothetical protein